MATETEENYSKSKCRFSLCFLGLLSWAALFYAMHPGLGQTRFSTQCQYVSASWYATASLPIGQPKTATRSGTRERFDTARNGASVVLPKGLKPAISSQNDQLHSTASNHPHFSFTDREGHSSAITGQSSNKTVMASGLNYFWLNEKHKNREQKSHIYRQTNLRYPLCGNADSTY